MNHTLRSRLRRLTAIALPIVLLVTLAISTQVSPSAFASGATYYVSKLGGNADGRSWATAWNELNQINWSVVQPGDTILLDGGSSQMVYTSTLTPTKSGTAAAPITIKLASDPGRNGQVAIFGGRSTPLPYCYQSGYVYQTAGVRTEGVRFGSVGYVVLDGMKWRGLAINGHNKAGVAFGSSSNHVTVRNVEVYDNGNAVLETNTASSHYNTWYPDQEGVHPSGSNNTFERAIVHDNGQDAFQTGSAFQNFAIRDSWLYNARTHPSGPDIPFNYCRHSDGFQVYGGGTSTGLTIEGSVFGPGFLQGTLLGQSGTQTAIVNNVTIRNTLFIDGANANVSGYNDSPSQNWALDHVTSYINRDTNKDILGGWDWALSVEGSNHSITDSIFYDGRIGLSAASNVRASGNVSYNLLSGSIAGVTADPQFVRPPASRSLRDAINADYTPRATAAQGKGSAITSVAQLLGQAPASPGNTPVSAATPTATPTVANTATRIPTTTATTTQAPVLPSDNGPTVTPTPSASGTPAFTPTPSASATLAFTPTPTYTSTPSSTPLPTSTPPSVTGGNFAVYTDGLAPRWQMASWGATVNPTSTSFVHSGKSAVSFTITEQQGAFAPTRLGSGAFDTTPYDTLRFYVNGEAKGGQVLAVMAYRTDTQAWTNLVGIDKYTEGGSVVAGQWRLVDIPLDVLGFQDAPISRIAIQGITGSPQPAVSVDDIAFHQGAVAILPVSGNPPTLTPTAKATKVPKLSPTETPSPAATSTAIATPTPTARPGNGKQK